MKISSDIGGQCLAVWVPFYCGDALLTLCMGRSIIQSTLDNPNLLEKLKKVQVSASSKRITGNKEIS